MRILIMILQPNSNFIYWPPIRRAFRQVYEVPGNPKHGASGVLLMGGFFYCYG